MLSNSQQQLLQLLKIQPLQLRTQFKSSSVATAEQAVTADTKSSVIRRKRQVPDSSHHCCQDVAVLLQKDPVVVDGALQFGGLNWSIDVDASESVLVGNELITPPFSLLQQPALKQQLWQQLSHYLEHA